MRTLESPADLRRFLGMVQYLAKFVPNLVSNSSALRQLLVKDANWEWTEEHTKQFADLQFLVTNSPVIKYFDPNLPVKLSVDASKSGLGSVLLQLHKDDWHPVAFASRALSKTERHYSQIEKETLAVLYASEKFNQFVYRHRFLVKSDHKPLQFIFKRNINKAPPRIQRLLLRLRKYDIDLIFSPGNSIPVPDALSQAYLPNTEEDDKSLEYKIHLLVSNLPISEPKLREMQNATENDQVLQKLKKLILDGFPDSKSSMPAELIPYFQVCSELSIAEGLIFKGDKIVIPESLRKEMKERIHMGHMGIECCKARAWQLMYWPNINADITNMVSNCSACLENRRYRQKEPLIAHEVPTAPWHKVGMDLFSFKGRDYLLVVDYFSNYPEVCLLNDTHNSSVIMKLKLIFSCFGIPKVVISDNGPQFSSYQFMRFAKEWDFTHNPSSPKHAKSNGMAESAVKTVKSIFKKAHRNKEDPYLALMAHRSTPSSSDNKSPYEKLFNRPMRTLLPDLRNIKRKSTEHTDLPAKLNPKFIERQKFYHNRLATELAEIPTGSTVRIHNGKNRPTKAKVIEKATSPRSYVVETEAGQTLRRNRRDLLKTSESFSRTEGDNDFPIPESSRTAIQLKPGNNENEFLPEVNNDSAQHYCQRLGTSVRPPNRYGFKDGQ